MSTPWPHDYPPQAPLADLPEQRAPDAAERPETDFYVTPRSVTEALIDAERPHWPRQGKPLVPDIWEPAAGGGHIVQPLTEQGYEVWASDIVGASHGCPEADRLNFLDANTLMAPVIVTNPPYRDDLPEAFARHALHLGAEACWLLCRLNWLEGQARSRWLQRAPLAQVWIIRQRFAMWPHGVTPKGKESSTPAYNHAWFGFLRGWRDPPRVGWLDLAPDLLDGC